MFAAESVKFKGRRMEKWCFGKIITYAVTFGIQLIVIYLFNTIFAVMLIICISIISFRITNHYEMPREFAEAQRERFSVLESHRDEEQKEFESLDYFSKIELLKRIPKLENMKIKPIPFIIVCVIVPCVSAVVYYFVLK